MNKTTSAARMTMSPSRDLHLSSDEIHDYFEIGWIVRRALFRADEVARMRACFDELEEIAGELPETGLHRGAHFVLGEKDGRRVVRRIVWAGGCQRYLLAIGNDERLTVPGAQLLRSNAMDHLLNQAHFKRPRDGVVFDWHQDIQHRDKGEGTWTDVNGCGSFVQTVIVLDEMTPDSGPLRFIPGSSKWGRVDFGDSAGDYPLQATKRPPQLREEDAVTIAAQAGDTLFFGPYTVHASFENTSDRYRRVLINGYASPGANRRVYPGDGAGRRLIAPTASSPDVHARGKCGTRE
jgi:ectoine hydroxylase-related dioxygenase (phytanoyl-CoA dioxygenase family)